MNLRFRRLTTITRTLSLLSLLFLFLPFLTGCKTEGINERGNHSCFEAGQGNIKFIGYNRGVNSFALCEIGQDRVVHYLNGKVLLHSGVNMNTFHSSKGRRIKGQETLLLPSSNFINNLKDIFHLPLEEVIEKSFDM